MGSEISKSLERSYGGSSIRSAISSTGVTTGSGQNSTGTQQGSSLSEVFNSIAASKQEELQYLLELANQTGKNAFKLYEWGNTGAKASQVVGNATGPINSTGSTGTNVGSNAVKATAIGNIQGSQGISSSGVDNSRPFGGQWSNYKEYTNYWSGKGGYINETGDYIDKDVMFKIHERPANAVVGEKTWMGVSEKLGFLFKDDNGSKMMNDAIGDAKSKLESNSQTKGLANDSWSLAFVAANGISKEALAGNVGKMLSFDNNFKEEFSGKRSNLMERDLHQQMHDITSSRLTQAATNEGLDSNQVKANLRELGHDTTQLSTFNYRAGLETGKNWDLVKNPDEFATKVKEHFDKHGFLPKFNVTADYFMDARKGDSMAFANADAGLEQAQQSALKGFGKDIKFSADPNATNELYFAVSGEKGLEKLQNALSESFTKAGLNTKDILKTYGDTAATRLAEKNGVLSQTGFSIHMHGGEDGTGMNEAGIVATTGPVSAEQAKEMDKNQLALGGQDANIMHNFAKFSAENGGDRFVMNAVSCHGNKHLEPASERFREGLANYDKNNGTSSETEVIRRGVNTYGTADAQGFGDKDGYHTYKYGATGEKNLEFVYSGDRRANVGPTINATEYYDGSGKSSNDTNYQKNAQEKFYNSVSEQTQNMNQYLDAKQGQETVQSKDSAQSNNNMAQENSNQKAKEQEQLIAKDNSQDAQRQQQTPQATA